MRALIDFFALRRPIFTLFALRIVWFAYLLSVALQYWPLVTGTIGAYGWRIFGLNLLRILLSAAVNLVLVRILLEVAAMILLPQDSALRSQTSAQGEA